MSKLRLNSQQIDECRRLATSIAQSVQKVLETQTTVSIERASLRLIGVEGAVQRSGQWYPECNAIVDALHAAGALSKGALYWFANGMIQKKMPVQELAATAARGKVDLAQLPLGSEAEIRSQVQRLVKDACDRLDQRRTERDAIRSETGDPSRPGSPNHNTWPLRYVIVATGNIFEDVVQAKAAAEAGADVVAVIRSTAQSLLDYVPHGATTEGYGGTYATQENFKIMRQALDVESRRLGRYIRLTNYCSGLCMAEIAAAASVERLDCLLNDAMYGILFRDINMRRTLVDQHFSRRILARSQIMIQTGEDNYLTTADAIENGHQVLSSQFINERFALNAGLSEQQLGLGHAQEMDPQHPNVILKELARAQMTRDIFPNSPIKFMPPTRFKCGDIFYSHLMDAMFNLVGVTTHQGVQLLGMATEAMHTPLLMDRWMSIKSANYIFNGAKDLGNEIEFKQGGVIESWGAKVLSETLEHLRMIENKGLFLAIEERAFAEVKRTETGGKGLDGVILRDADYLNPFYEQL